MAKKTNISHKEKADTALKSASSVLERISGSTVSTQNPENDLKDEEELPDNVQDAENNTDSNSAINFMMNQNFIEYASYVIKDRAIPDVNDGLKPVQRRILWAMKQGDTGNFDKVANIIGNTMHFHPHGDASIGEALVNLANKNYYIERQGNYGHVMTGAPAAAPRYIEARLTSLAREVLFNDDITLLCESYDGRNMEPVVLPSKLPTLLLQGTDGIAVGTNTKIMPHNFNEVLHAQISYLRNEPFTLYPDFIQGGMIDVSKYDDGCGKITIRAKLEIESKNIVIREIPPVTDTKKLLDSIEKAINNSKIKIVSQHDYTAENVEIELVPIRGYQPEKAIDALYTYTQCQMGIVCSPMVILNNRPVQMSVSEILKHCTNQLVQYLSWELQIASIKNLEKILVRTLVQIFIEEKIYKKIEKCTDKSSMFSEVRNGLEKFRKEWYPIVQKLFDMSSNGPHIMPIGKETQKRLDQLEGGIIPDIDIEHLLEIPIRRIAAFEIEKNRKEISLEQKGLDENLRNLKKIKSYTIKYLQGILDKYGSLYPRRSKITIDGFEKIDKRAIALNNIRVGWDKKNCYIGTNVKSDEVVICNDFDHLLCIERNGSFKIINIPTKIFIDRLYEFRKYDKNTVFGIVYSDKKSGKVYAKRSAISSFTVDREYRLIPENCKLEVITSRPNAIYEIIIDTPIKSKQKIVYNLLDAPQRSSKAGGILVSNRKMLKISFSQYTDNTGESSAERDLVNVSTQEESISSKKSQNEENSDDKKEIISSEVKIEREEDSWKAQPDLGF